VVFFASGRQEGGMMEGFYEFHLDESGSFGDWVDPFKGEAQKKTDMRIVGGVIVPPAVLKRETEFQEQMQGIRKKYFPNGEKVTDIHISEIKDKAEQSALRGELRDFFKTEMKGVQIAFIYDRTPVVEGAAPPGAQLYRNMLFHLLQTVLFYHPFFQGDSKVLCKVSHRRFAYPAKFEDYLAGQGYLKLRDPVSGKTLLTAVQQAELENLMTSFGRALRFQSRRRQAYMVKPYRDWDSPFMVMADWICNALLRIVPNNKKEKNIVEELKKYLGGDRVLFFCASDYELPETVLSTYYQRRYDDFLFGYLHREKRIQSPDSLLLYPAYQNVMKTLQDAAKPLNDEQCDALVRIADGMLENRLYGRFRDVGNLITILGKRLNETIHGEPDADRDRLAWRYHDAALRYANHTGNTGLGRFHHKRGTALFQRLSDKSVEDVRSYHEFVNRSSIINANEFAFLRACDLLAGIEEKEEAYNKLFPDVRNKIYGKICGTLAQNYAFLGDKRAVTYFGHAATHLGRSDKMQTSFRAHFFLDHGSGQHYLREVCGLLECKDFPGYQKAIALCLRDLSDSDNVFLLHLLLKGLLLHGEEHDKETVVSSLSGRRSMLELRHHPWELVFTVLGRLLHELEDGKTARVYWQRSVGFAQNKQVTLKMLGHAANAWSALSWLDEGDKGKAREALKPIAATFRRFRDGDSEPGILNPHKKSDIDGKIRQGWFDNIGNRFFTEFDEADKDTLASLANEFVSRFTFNYW